MTAQAINSIQPQHPSHRRHAASIAIVLILFGATGLSAWAQAASPTADAAPPTAEPSPSPETTPAKDESTAPHEGASPSPTATNAPETAGSPSPTSAPDSATEGEPASDPEADKKLIEQLESYFKADGPGARARIARDLAKADEVTVERVANLLPQMKLWKALDSNTLKVPLKGAITRENLSEPPVLWIRVPEKYDPDKAWPLLILFGADGQMGSPEEMPRLARLLVGDDADKFILATPKDGRPAFFAAPQPAAGIPSLWIQEIHRRVHTDADRTYVAGWNLGGHAALMFAATQPHLFAGALSINGPLVLTRDIRATDLLLPNLKATPTLFIHLTGDVLTQENRMYAVPTDYLESWLRVAHRIAEEEDLPFEVATVSSNGEEEMKARAGVTKLLQQTRPSAPKSFGYWFRYPAQGSTAWARQTDFTDGPWTANVLAVDPAPSETYIQAVTAVLSEKYAFIGGKVNQQEVSLTAGRTDELEIWLNADLIDFAEPVTILLDGTVRFEGPVRPRLTTLLERAAETYDFQHTWPVHFVIPIKGRARPF